MESKTTEEKQQLTLNTYIIYFSNCMSDFSDLLRNKSVELINTKRQDGSLDENTRFYKSHTRLQKACQSYKTMFEDPDGAESGKTWDFVKRVFKILTSNLQLLHPEPDNNLFKMVKNNAVVTIIPGLEIGILIDEFNERERELFWAYIYFLLIASTQLTAVHNPNSGRVKAVKEIISHLRAKVKKSGIIEFGRLNNPWIGLNFESNESLDIETMMKGMGEMKTEGFISFVEDQINKVLDMDSIKDHLANIGEEEIKSVKQHIGEMFDNDPNISGIADLLPDIISNIKDIKASGGGKLGIRDLTSALDSQVDKMDIKFDEKTITNTASKLSNFLSKSQQDVAEMKDDNGNPVGEQLLQTLQIPLSLLSGLQSGKMDKRQAKKLEKDMKKEMAKLSAKR